MRATTLFVLGVAFLALMSFMGCTPAPCAEGCMSATVDHERMMP